MAQKNRATFRIKLRGPHGFAQLRYAKTFEIWYGKRRISGPQPFPPKKKKVSERRSYLERKLDNIEQEYFRLLAEAREQRALEKKKLERAAKRHEKKLAEAREQRALEKKKRERAAKRLEKKLLKEAVAKPIESESEKEEQEQFTKARKLLSNEFPDFNNAEYEEPQTLVNATIKDVMVVPIIPVNDTYTKELIEKIITSNRMTETLYLTILNFGLTEENIIPMDLSTFYDSFRTSIAVMIPHLWDFYTQVKGSTDAWILRIRYSYEPKGKQHFQEQGISLVRTHGLNSKKAMLDHFIWTFKRFIGEAKDPKTPFKKNYLTGDTLIYITGFTLEATTYG